MTNNILELLEQLLLAKKRGYVDSVMLCSLHEDKKSLTYHFNSGSLYNFDNIPKFDLIESRISNKDFITDKKRKALSNFILKKYSCQCVFVFNYDHIILKIENCAPYCDK
ncbi:hypothetical protein UFOVP410_117 [uncultured Caudovirales phage]|uniref:Uncharacterized protein n=1 Tax=uncultured Caudovirales phage TaxID=2100421 RepID=A0A6J5M3U1_9CAUD|nr:hypothetical protein UFOVP410_117 [uncultured Caudovirales phage]